MVAVQRNLEKRTCDLALECFQRFWLPASSAERINSFLLSPLFHTRHSLNRAVFTITAFWPCYFPQPRISARLGCLSPMLTPQMWCLCLKVKPKRRLNGSAQLKPPLLRVRYSLTDVRRLQLFVYIPTRLVANHSLWNDRNWQLQCIADYPFPYFRNSENCLCPRNRP